MNNALCEGRKIRSTMGLVGPVDMETVAEQSGLFVDYMDMPSEIHEVQFGTSIGVNKSLNNVWRRWAAARGLGQFILHRDKRSPSRSIFERIGAAWESQTRDFAYGLLVPSEETCLELGLINQMEIARYAEVPEFIARIGYLEGNRADGGELDYWMYNQGWGRRE